MAVLVRTIDKYHRLNVVPLSDSLADLVFCDLSVEFRWATLHVVNYQGDILSAGVAILCLIQFLFNPNPFIMRLLTAQVSKSLANYLYFKVSKYRSYFGLFLPNFPPVCIKRDETRPS